MIHVLLTFHPEIGAPSPGVQAAILLLLVGLSAFFSGSEVALVSLSRLRRRQMVEEGVAGAEHIEALFHHPNRFLVTILIGNNLVNIAAASIATSLAIGLFGSTGVGIATGIMTFLILTFGEITPKAYASLHSERWSLVAAPVVLVLERALYPAVLAYAWFTKWTFEVFGADDVEPDAAFRDEEELKTLITMGREEGILEEEEREMIHSVIEFGDTVAREIMVPRTDVVAIHANESLDTARELSLESGFSRIPVYEDSLDDIVGIVFVKDLLDHIVQGHGHRTVRSAMKDPYFVPESKRLDDLLRTMQAKRVHLAIVVDEFGGTDGIITMEDVLEEIVGEIFDEYDLRKEPINRLDERTAVVDARLDVAEVNAQLDIQLPDEEHYESVGGLITHELGRLGQEGELVNVNGVDLLVEKGSDKRILRVRIVKDEGASGPEPDA